MAKLFYIIYTIPVRLILYIKGVNLGKGVLFGGFPLIKKTKGARIVIGEHCRFMSKETGNMIGLNHRCFITAQNEHSQIFIGKNCGFSGTSIRCFNLINIGNNVKVGANVLIIDGDAHQNDPRAGKDSPIIIEDNVWVGANVMILKGVTIGRNSLIGAGSVVVKDIPDNVVAAGNPCKVIKELTSDVIEQLNYIK